MNKIVYFSVLFLFLTVYSRANYWTQKADLPGLGRADAAGFSIGTKGYIGTGYVTGYTKDWYEYNPATNLWSQKADYGGAPIVEASTFTIDDFGYVLPAYLDTKSKSYRDSKALCCRFRNWREGIHRYGLQYRYKQ